MFKPREPIESGAGGPAAIAATLCHVQRLPVKTPGFRTQFRNLERHLVHDLAEDIGSARWYRGFGTMAALSVVAAAFWPDFSAVDAAPILRVDSAERDEFRSQMILPLTAGGESGRHMAADPRKVSPLSTAPERVSIQMVATLAQGDSFGRMLQRAGVGPYDAARSVELVGAVLPLAEIKPGTRFDITLGKREAPGLPRSLDKLDFRARFDTALTIARTHGDLTIGRHAIAVDNTPLRIRGTVGPSLYRSARAAGAPAEAIQQFLQAVDQHVSLEEIAATDQFDLVIAYKRSAGGEAEGGKLLFAGIESGGKPRVQLVRDGNGQLQDALGGAPRQDWSSSVVLSGGANGGGGGLLAPVNGRVTSPYGLRRHPILGYARMHAGIDFGAPWGSPIFAVSPGVVTYAGRHGGHGNYVRLEHGGFGTGYGHMSRIAVAAGTKVSAGQVIGYVGSTGLSTGPHLHYEVYQGGRTVNPAGFSFSGKVQVVKVQSDEAKQQPALKALLAKFRGVKPGAALGKFNPKAPALD